MNIEVYVTKETEEEFDVDVFEVEAGEEEEEGERVEDLTSCGYKSVEEAEAYVKTLIQNKSYVVQYKGVR